MDDRERLAWFAGFFDGEGCVAVRRSFPSPPNRQKNINHGLTVNIKNTNEEVLKLCKTWFGGSIKRINGFENTAVSWTWTIYSKNALRFLEKILPYLKIKDKEVICALEFHELLRVTRAKPTIGQRYIPKVPLEVIAQRDAYYWRLRELKIEAKTYD